MKAKVDAKKYSALVQMHYGRMKNKMKVKVKKLQKQILDHPLLLAICQNGKLKLLSPWHFVTSGLCSILSGAARPSLTPIFLPPFCPTAGSASMGFPADLDHQAPHLSRLGQACPHPSS